MQCLPTDIPNLVRRRWTHGFGEEYQKQGIREPPLPIFPSHLGHDNLHVTASHGILDAIIILNLLLASRALLEQFTNKLKLNVF